MDLSASSLFASLFVSSVGVGFFIYGKKQRRPAHLAGGLALTIFPYFVSSALVMIAIAAAIVAGVWIAARQGW